MALILLRHLDPVIAPGICYGRADIAARAPHDGELAALVAALPPISRIDTSPLRRCHLLAEQIGARLDVPVRTDARLCEIDFGAWELRAWDDIPRAEIDQWAADLTGARPHGGESVAQMIARARSYLDDQGREPANILVVTHLGFVRCAHAALDLPGALELKLGHGAWIELAVQRRIDKPPARIA